MSWIDETVWCDGCGVEISWGPVVVSDRKYCCQDCAAGLPCDCGTRLEFEDERRSSQDSSPYASGGYPA
jgi:hypothetical protein